MHESDAAGMSRKAREGIIGLISIYIQEVHKYKVTHWCPVVWEFIILEVEMEQENKKIFGYVRVSTREQNEDRQIVALKDAGVPEKNIYMDKLSGKNFNRPQYKRLLKKLDGESVLFIKSIDRLGRNYRDLSDQWRIITKDKKADVVVIDMPILDTRREKNLLGTFISDLILALLSYVAESEYTTIHQRQAEGIAAAKAKGVKLGRPPKQLPENFYEVYQGWTSGKISTAEAARQVDMPISTFRYRASVYKNARLLKGK